jgi:hypothetical protein
MAIEIARLLLGLLIAGFHQKIADFIGDREHSLVMAFRERGVPFPAALSRETFRNFYFGMGIFVVLIEMLRLYQMSH